MLVGQSMHLFRKQNFYVALLIFALKQTFIWHRQRYLLNKHLLGIRAPANDELCIAVRQAFPCDLNKELKVTRSALELLHLGKRDGARHVRDEAVQNAHVFVARQLTRRCTLYK